jgi:hypothetical protein
LNARWRHFLSRRGAKADGGKIQGSREAPAKSGRFAEPVVTGIIRLYKFCEAEACHLTPMPGLDTRFIRFLRTSSNPQIDDPDEYAGFRLEINTLRTLKNGRINTPIPL